MTPAGATRISPTKAAQRWAARARRRSRRGVALLMVLGTLSVLTVMLTEFQDSASAEFGSSVSARDQLKAEYAARSAVNLTRLLIAAEPTIRASLGVLLAALGGEVKQISVWEFTDVILGAFNDQSGQELFSGMSGLDLTESRNLGMDGAGFALVVVDEDSKVNFNLAARADSFSQQRMAEQILALIGGIQYNELFEQLDDEGELHDRQTVCGALIDWADPNTDRSPCDPRSETATSAGAEDSYYQLLPRPYGRKNAPFDSLEELRLVRGVGDEFWRTFVQPDPDDPKSRVVTVWGSGAINANSANAQTLLAIACHKAVPDSPLCTDPMQQMQFLATIGMLKMVQQGMPIFTSPKAFVRALQGKGNAGTALTAMGITPLQLLSESEVEKAVSVESKVFSIHATGLVTSGKRQTRSRVTAVVDFRGAPAPGTAEQFAALERAKEAGLVQDPDPNADPNAADNPYLRPSPGGSVLYFRVD